MAAWNASDVESRYNRHLSLPVPYGPFSPRWPQPSIPPSHPALRFRCSSSFIVPPSAMNHDRSVPIALAARQNASTIRPVRSGG